jgi:hypothetical protein
VLVSHGRTIYSAPSDQIVDYFCSSAMSYRITGDIEIVDFIFDIADGTERPTAQRKALDATTLQTSFEQSKLRLQPLTNDHKIKILPETSIPNYGYLTIKTTDLSNMISSSLTVIGRAFFVKFKEYEVLKKSFISSIMIGLFIGYFLYKQGEYGDYTMALLGIPYSKTTNLTGTLFILLAVTFVQQILNVHIICQKIQVFRYERDAKCNPTIGFFIAAFISEIPFTIFFALICANITYFLADLNDGFHNYIFYMGVQMLIGIVGFTTTLMFASVFRREIVVRDLFLFCLFMMVMTTGFIFQQTAMTEAAVDISRINCLRWAYEAIMVWKFYDYKDGPVFLETYGFSAFNKNKVFGILTNFIIFDMIIFFISLIPLPNTLIRRQKNDNIKQMDTEDDIKPRKPSIVKPNLFMRESSITGTTHLASRNSAHGLENDIVIHGPKVTFRNLEYRVPDPKSPIGYKCVLHQMTGR